ncbi:MAG: hypothetical protein EZS28_004487, partial [Streblomastix strix]
RRAIQMAQAQSDGIGGEYTKLKDQLEDLQNEARKKNFHFIELKHDLSDKLEHDAAEFRKQRINAHDEERHLQINLLKLRKEAKQESDKKDSDEDDEYKDDQKEGKGRRARRRGKDKKKDIIATPQLKRVTKDGQKEPGDKNQQQQQQSSQLTQQQSPFFSSQQQQLTTPQQNWRNDVVLQRDVNIDYLVRIYGLQLKFQQNQQLFCLLKHIKVKKKEKIIMKLKQIEILKDEKIIQDEALDDIKFTLAIQQTLVSVRAQQAFTSAASAINNSEIIELTNSAVKQEERMILRDVVYKRDNQIEEEFE